MKSSGTNYYPEGLKSLSKNIQTESLWGRFLGQQRDNTEFLSRGSTINTDTYCELLRNLDVLSETKDMGSCTTKEFFLHNNS